MTTKENEKAEDPLVRLKNKKLPRVLDILFSIIWLYLLLKIFVFDPDRKLLEIISPELIWLLNYRWIFFVLGCALFWKLLGSKNFTNLVLLFAFYPFLWLCIRFSRFLLKRWSHLLFFSPIIFSFINHFRSTLVLFFGSILSTVLIFKDVSDQLIILSMCFLGLSLGIYLFRSLRQAFTSNLFEDFSDFVKTALDKVESGEVSFFESENSAENQEKEIKPRRKKEASAQLFLYLSYQLSDLVSCRMNQLVRSRALDIYLTFSILINFLVTVLVFQVMYIGLYNLDQSNFNLQSDFSYLLFFILSIESFFSLDFSLMIPSSIAATVLSRVELLVAILIGVILISTWRTVFKDSYKKDVEELSENLSLIIVALDKIAVAAYQKSILQMELALARQDKVNKWVIDYLRTSRGLEKLSEEIIEGELDPVDDEEASKDAPHEAP